MPERLAAVPKTFFTADGAHLSIWAYAFLVLLSIALFTPGLSSLPPTDRDESSFAQASKQMIESGNYVDIRLQDKPRYKKPIGIYWLQTASVHLFDRDHLNEIWAYRIPSFLGATVAVLMTAVLGSLLFGPMTGLLAAFMMAGCVLLNVEARLAKTDASLLATIMIAQYALARAYKGLNRPWLTFFLFWTSLGAGILVKGPIILLTVLSTLLGLRLTDRNLARFAPLKPLYGLPYLLLLVAPWFVAIMLQSHGAFLQQSAGQDMLAKLWQGQNRGMLPPGLHLLAMPIVFFPFGFVVLLASPTVWNNRHDPYVRFCLSWIIPTWIVFELSLTKLPHYVLPIYPAIAILAAKTLVMDGEVIAEHLKRWATVGIVTLWVFVTAGFAIAFALLPYISDHRWNGAQIAAGAALIIAQTVGLFLFPQRKTESILVMLFGSLIFMPCVFGNTLPTLKAPWMSRQIVQIAESVKPCDATHIVSASYGEPSLVFLAGTDTEIVAKGEEAAEAMQNDHCLVAAIDAKHKQDFLDGFKGTMQPLQVGVAQGMNAGKAKPAELSIYVMPPKGLMP